MKNRAYPVMSHIHQFIAKLSPKPGAVLFLFSKSPAPAPAQAPAPGIARNSTFQV